MNIHSYTFWENSILVYSKYGQPLRIYLNRDSGKPYARKKVQTVALRWVKHTGIYLGHDDNGTHWFAHNHTNNGTVVLANHHEFSQGEVLHSYPIDCNRPPRQVIQNILQQGINGKPYDWSDYNCQTATNLACNGTSVSEDASAGKWLLGGTALLAALLIIPKLVK